MLTVSGHRCVDVLSDSIVWSERRCGGWKWKDAVTAIPDFCDPATVGCLLALVREKHGPEAHTEPTGGGRWEFHADAEAWGGICKDTEAEALVSALEQVER